jgi:hypothetical protein
MDNLIVAKSEVQHLFAWETPLSDHPYINIKLTKMTISNSPNLTVYFRNVTDVFIQIWYFYEMITFLLHLKYDKQDQQGKAAFNEA